MSVQYANVMRETVPLVVAAPEEPPAPEVTADEHSILGLTELLLKDPDRVDRLAREEDEQPFLIPRFLTVGLTSFSLFALALVLTLGAAPTAALPWPLSGAWADHPTESGVALWLAYALGFTLTTGVCLPSFYFYALLAGVRVSWLQVTAQIMKGQAATAVMLLGVLPVYLAAALGAVVFAAPADVLRAVLYAGLGLPFAAGLGTPVQWVFDRTGPSGLRRGQYLAVSLSGADREIEERTEVLRERFLPALAEMFPRAADAVVERFFVTREHHATFRQAPGTAALRPGPRTDVRGLFLAGAWTATGWPATMEGAVRSGLAAARAVLGVRGAQEAVPA